MRIVFERFGDAIPLDEPLYWYGTRLQFVDRSLETTEHRFWGK